MLNIFAVRSDSKFHFVHVAVSKIHPPNNFYKINHRESLIVNCFVNSSAFSTFYVTFIKIINVDTNNICVYLKFMVNVANLFLHLCFLCSHCQLVLLTNLQAVCSSAARCSIGNWGEPQS